MTGINVELEYSIILNYFKMNLREAICFASKLQNYYGKGMSLMSYKELSKKSVYETEKELAKYWNDIDLLGQSVETREGKENFVFYDGPPTANGRPGIHHVISRALKDSVCRYKTMKGFKVKRKAGWDTHGLPVEIEVEKRLKHIIPKLLFMTDMGFT